MQHSAPRGPVRISTKSRQNKQQSASGKSSRPVDRVAARLLSLRRGHRTFLLATARPASAGFIDGFESAALNPFWTQQAQSGFITLSGAQVHTGSQAVQFNLIDTGIDKSITLEHTFATPTYGSFSVWLYDTGADIGSSNYLTFTVSAIGTHNFGAIGTEDYDLGTGQNGSTYELNPLNDQIRIVTGVDRTQGWHQFLIDTTPTQAVFQIDGTTVYTVPGVPVDYVSLSMHGPWWRPAWTSYWDDFEFRESAAVPEPGSLSLALIGFGVLITVVAARRKGRGVSGCV